MIEKVVGQELKLRRPQMVNIFTKELLDEIYNCPNHTKRFDFPFKLKVDIKSVINKENGRGYFEIKSNLDRFSISIDDILLLIPSPDNKVEISVYRSLEELEIVWENY